MKDHDKKKCCSGHPIINSVGELVILCQRKTYALAFDLPYCIWGAMYLNTNFSAVLQPYLPVTVPPITVTTAIVNNNTIRFTYTNGIETDTIEVTNPDIGLISYPEMLSNLNTNYMRSDFLIFNCNYGTGVAFLTDDQINLIKLGGLYLQQTGGTGSKNAQLIIPLSRTSMNNSTTNVTEIYLRREPIKQESVWIHQAKYISQPAPPTILPVYAFTVFISERINVNEEKKALFEKVLNHQD